VCVCLPATFVHSDGITSVWRFVFLGRFLGYRALGRALQAIAADIARWGALLQAIAAEIACLGALPQKSVMAVMSRARRAPAMSTTARLFSSNLPRSVRICSASRTKSAA
jgi:hypothetical protein